MNYQMGMMDQSSVGNQMQGQMGQIGQMNPQIMGMGCMYNPGMMYDQNQQQQMILQCMMKPYMMKLGMPYPSMMQMMTAQQQMLHQMMVQQQIMAQVNKNEQKKNILNNTMNDILHVVFRRNESLFWFNVHQMKKFLR